MRTGSSLGSGPDDSPKALVATPLEPTGLLDDGQLELLALHSITSVEELLGAIAAAPRVVGRLLAEPNIARLQEDAGELVRAEALDEMTRVLDHTFPLGAWRPERVGREDPARPERPESGWGDDLADDDLDDGLDQDDVEADRWPDEKSAGGVSLMDRFGPVRDQGERATSVAHAVCAVLECQEQRLTGRSQELSEHFVHWNAKSRDGHPHEDGTWLGVAMRLAATDGACRRSTWPYEPQSLRTGPAQGPPPRGAREEAAEHRLVNPVQLSHGDPFAMRAFIEEGRPVALTVPVYDVWSRNPAVTAFGLIPVPLPGSRLRAGHAVCAIGFEWDEDFAGGGYLVVRSSWGTRWATQSPVAAGYGLLPFAYVERYGWEAWTTADGDPPS